MGYKQYKYSLEAPAERNDRIRAHQASPALLAARWTTCLLVSDTLQRLQGLEQHIVLIDTSDTNPLQKDTQSEPQCTHYVHWGAPQQAAVHTMMLPCCL